MFSEWSPFVWLAITLVPLILLKRWINRHVQGLSLLLLGDNDLAMFLYFVLFLPGILLHELSHWLMAKLLGVKTGKMSIWPSRRKAGRQMRLGSVKVGRADPVRNSLIGLAPLLSGTLVILLIGDWILGLSTVGDIFLSGEWPRLWDGLVTYVQVPDFWLWLYLIFAVSNAMLPSETDRQSWRLVLIFWGAVAVLLYFVGWVPQVPEAVADWLLTAIGYLAYVFGLTIAVDVIFIVIIAILERLLMTLRRARVEY
jgi:hypothetical protein